MYVQGNCAVVKSPTLKKHESSTIQRAISLCLVALVLQINHSFAQFVEIAPVHKEKYSLNSKSTTSKILNTNFLPFWDDFSKGIDTLKWTIAGASYTEAIANNAPSLGAVLFNGVDQNGRPYSSEIRDQGESDFLTSKPFDLSNLPEAQKESLYLSFFWQAGGKAERPDANDGLTLQILNPAGEWIQVWQQTGGDDLDMTSFTQEVVKILPGWQHESFQFRFFSTGRLVGPFDSWLIDYVYLNANRDENDQTYSDRALTQFNQVTFSGYSAYPLELLTTDQSGLWSQVQNEFNNLEDRFRAMEYSIQLEDSLGNPLLKVNEDTPFNPVPNSLERRTFLSRDFDGIPLPTAQSDLYIRSYLTSGDDVLQEIQNGESTPLPSVDFRINDTIRTKFPVRDFFAYDYGSADYAAGINQRSGQLAVQYTSPEPAYITGISINFTNARQANQPVDIVVWDELDQPPVFSMESLIPEKIAGKDFAYFALDTNLRVSGDFYVGFTQYSNDFIHIGLDKINDQGDKIYYNVGGNTWVQNEVVKGALMIRPHISLAPPMEEIDMPEARIRIYPNPVVDRLVVEGRFTDLVIFDSFGRQILLPTEKTYSGEIVNFIGQRPGVYIIHLSSDTESKSFRILVKK